MSAGIVSFGAYVPFYRLSSSVLAKTWGYAPGKSEKAVANWDEDSLTMAVEASIDALKGFDRAAIDTLYLASTTSSYREKLSASIMAKVLDFRRDVAVADFADSTRSATIALKSALDAVNAGSAKQSLVAVADCRLPAPSTDLEQQLGDAAAALLIGTNNVAVEIEGSYTISSEFIDIWRRNRDKYVNTWEDRFIIEHGYYDHIKEVIAGLYKKYKLTNASFNKVVLYPFDSRRLQDLAKMLGFAPAQIQDPLLAQIGHTGSSASVMALVSALEDAKPGERILWVNYGDGADAYVLRTTDKINSLKNRRGVKKHIASKLMMPHYGMYLQFRDMMEWENRFQLQKFCSLPMSWRDRDMILSFKGTKCTNCNNILLPPQRICPYCQAQDKNEPVRLSEVTGKLFTYSLDSLAALPDPPNIVAIVNLDGGGRFSTSLTDRDPTKLTPEMPVELTFRKFHEGKGVINYFWKARPFRV